MKMASVRYIYCKICDNSYRVYTAVIKVILRPVGLATLSNFNMNVLRQGTRTLYQVLDSALTHSIFERNTLS